MENPVKLLRDWLGAMSDDPGARSDADAGLTAEQQDCAFNDLLPLMLVVAVIALCLAMVILRK